MLPRPYGVDDLEAATLESGSLVPLFPPHGFVALPDWNKWSVLAQRRDEPHHSLIAEQSTQFVSAITALAFIGPELPLGRQLCSPCNA